MEFKALELAPKQIEGMQMARAKKFVLLSGPRISGKTLSSLPAICDHAWNIAEADICVLTISQSVGVDSGVWDQLVRTVLPRYMAIGQGMTWHKEPHIRSGTKKPACSVYNRHGGISRISLESLNDESEVEERFKSRNYTMIYVPELSNFKERKTFDILGECLRGIGIPDDQFLFLADTNPADEGDESWIYHVWYIHRTQTYDDYCVFQAERGMLPADIIDEETFKSFQSQLGLVEFEIADNWFITPKRVKEITARYAHDKDLYDRYIKGLWVKATSGALFAKQFRELKHVIGELETRANPNPEMLVPETFTRTLYTSHDPGNSANSASTIFEKIVLELPGGKFSLPIFKILDELVVVGEQHTLPEYTKAFLDKMHWWEDYCGRKFEWEHWSDRSVFDMQEPMRNRYYHEIIREASNGEIQLKASDRGAGSVAQRVDLVRRLFFENRLFISRPKCPQFIQMCKAMPADKNNPMVPPKGHKLKHIFDGGTYGIASESYDEMQSSGIRSLNTGPYESSLVSIQV